MTGPVVDIIKLTLRRKITVLMLLSSCILAGALSIGNLRLEFLPSGFVNTEVSISIPVPDANPVEVEEQVTKPTVEILNQISGREKITSRSSKDRASINIEFARGREPNEAFAEVRDLMERAKLQWPEQVQEYTTFRFNLDTDFPIFQFGLLLDEWETDTSFLIDEKVIREIESVDGVARCNAWGIVEETIRIFVDKEKARANGVSIYDLSQKLGGDNRDVIGGRITDGGQHFYLRSMGRFRDLDEIRNFPIRPDLRIRDVASVEAAKVLRNFVFRMNGKRAIWFQINKEATANTVDVCRRINERIKTKIVPDRRLKEKGWTFYLNDLNNFGGAIERSLSGLVEAALLGGLLAIIPLFCFLRRVRLTMIIALAIPSSLMLGLTVTYFSGGTLNILSMLGFTIAIGMLVDNAIVVVENIVRYREQGLSAFDAALRGTSEVALAITLATLTSVIVFVPLLFLDGAQELSFFATAVSLPVCYTVLGSLVVALLFVPLGTMILYPGSITRDGRGILDRLATPLYLTARLVNKFIDLLTRGHTKVLSWCLRNRLASILFIIVTSSIFTKIGMESISMEGFGDESGGRVRVSVELDSNFTLGDANEIFHELYGAIAGLSDEMATEYCFYFFDRTGGALNIGLVDQGPDAAKAAVSQIQKALPKKPGVKWRVGLDRQNEDRTALKLVIYGADVDQLAAIGDDLTARLEALDEVSEVKGAIGKSQDEIIIQPNRELMQLMKINPEVLVGTVQYGIRGQRLPDFQAGDQKLQVIIEFDEESNTSLSDLEGMQIWSDQGVTHPLSHVAEVRKGKGYGTIRKSDGRSSMELTISTVDASKSELSAAVQKFRGNYELPDGYSWSETSNEDLAAQQREIAGTLVLALVLVMLLMGVLFESVMLPGAVLFTIPFAFMGSLWTLAATGTDVDIVGMIGAVVLLGIVVNNAIVFLDCAHRLRKETHRRTDALLEAGRLRLRPILMTTATTVIGLLPMAMTEASGSFVSYKALARGVMGGLTVSTLATLIVVPIAYTLLDDLRTRAGEILKGRRAEPGLKVSSVGRRPSP